MIDKEKILNDLNEYFIWYGKVTIDDQTGKVSVTGNVILNRYIKHTKLPVQFGVVDGGFSCDSNSLKTLAGAPRSVSGNFSCVDNSLETLVGAPQSVGGEFWCDYKPDLGLLRIILSNCSNIMWYNNAPYEVTRIIKNIWEKDKVGHCNVLLN